MDPLEPGWPHTNSGFFFDSSTSYFYIDIEWSERLARWTIDSLPWEQFDHSKVSPSLLAYAKAAALVEANGHIYIDYLKKVFPEDLQLQADIEKWGAEETQHGRALRAWAEKADPSFDYEKAMEIYQSAFRFPESPIRGSQAMELVSRCAIETGTSSFYTAMKDVADEPVFKELCRRIAGDEIRHYNLFYGYLQKSYSKGVSRWSRLRMLLKRSLEVTDEELCFAYAAANLGEVIPSDLPRYANHYLNFLANIFESKHLKHAMAMMGRAAGFNIPGRFAEWLAIVLKNLFRLRLKRAGS
jgi:rubrerythrin